VILLRDLMGRHLDRKEKKGKKNHFHHLKEKKTGGRYNR
jgi:hypothetical protein